MTNFIFKTTTTMKEYNYKKWWIDRNVIPEIRIKAENLKDALEQYREIVNDKYCVEISRNAIKTKSPMYVDTTANEAKQVGWVITGKTDFNDDYYRWVSQYIDLWVTVLTVVDTDFSDDFEEA